MLVPVKPYPVADYTLLSFEKRRLSASLLFTPLEIIINSLNSLEDESWPCGDECSSVDRRFFRENV